MNPFEAGSRKVIPAVLIYVRSAGRFLMIHRQSESRPEDHHIGKWNGLGGKCELDESPRESARRELLEESGLNLPEERLTPLGVLQFPNFKPKKCEDWVVFVFTAEVDFAASEGTLKQVEEGTLHWVPAAELLSLNLWPGDRHFIPFVVALKPFMGTIWYRGEEVVRHSVVPLA